MKKELFSFKNLLKFILIILFLLSISFVVEYNIKEYDKQNKNETNVVKESFIFLKDLNATEVENSSSFEAQTDINNEIIKKLNEEMYTIDSPLIVTNPYKINPLSAIIAFNTKEDKSINVVINGEYSYTSSESKIHILPVYYLYGDTTNKISLNGIEIDIDINIETDTIDNNTNNLLFIDRDNLLNAFKNEKQVMSLSVELDDYLIENNSNFLIKNDDVLFTITPYGLITSMYYFNSNIIDYIEDTNNIYVLLDNSLIKINRTTKEETTYQISGTNIDINNDILIISNNNSIYFYNTNGELISIFGENTTPELKEYYLKRNYNTKYLTNILDIKYKDDYLYVLENNNTLRVFLINLSNKQIRAYKTLTNINISNITYEDKLIGNNYEIDNFKTSNIINTRTNKSYIKYPNILIDEATSIYYQSIISVYNTLDDNTVLSFKDVETKDIDISKIDNTLVIDNNDIESIILLNEKGNSYEYKLNVNRYIDISNINDGKYFIYTKVNSIVYNVNRYIVKRSIYE